MVSNPRTVHRSFAGGEVSPEMFGRADTQQYQSGAARLRNMLVRPQGPAFRRPGLKLLRSVKRPDERVQLIPFTFSTDQTYAVEVGMGYFRFHSNGGTLLYDNPATYVPVATIASRSGDTLTTFAAHGFNTGDPLAFYQTAGALPPPLEDAATRGSAYYAIVLTATTFQVAETAADALAATAITLTADGSGTRQVHRVYFEGDLARFTPVSDPFNFYCRQSTLLSVPAATPLDTDYWYELPSDQPDGENIFEVPNDYADEDHLFELTWDQSFDVLTIAHQSYPTLELRRLGATWWTALPVDFGPAIAAPVGLAAAVVRGNRQDISLIDKSGGGAPGVGDALRFNTNTNHALGVGDTIYLGPGTSGSSAYVAQGFYRVVEDGVNALTDTQFWLSKIEGGAPVKGSDTSGAYTAAELAVSPAPLSSANEETYVVTAVNSDGNESEPSDPVTATNNLSVSGSSNTITWTAVAGAKRYNVYKRQSGLFGYIGQVDGDDPQPFVDDNIAPDLGVAPPTFDESLSGTDYPGAVGRVEGRRGFAGTANGPQDMWLTRSGTESDLSYSLPTQASDRIYFRVAARQAATIRHIVPLSHLLLLTSGGELRVTPVNTDALTPGSVSVRPQSYVGANLVQPVVVHNTVVFCAARGGHLFEAGYSVEGNGFIPGDLSLRAAHLFDNKTLTGLTQSKAPLPILWVVSSDGKLLAFTYVPGEQIGAWSWMDTDGSFEAVCAIPEGAEDAVYVIVSRDGGRFVEFMPPQAATAVEDAFFVDSGLTYDGVPVSVVSGLDHLEGKTVKILADGLQQPDQVVTGGTVTLVADASVVHVGLPFTSQLVTLPAVLAIGSDYGTGRTKNATRAWVRVIGSGQFQLGPSETDLVNAFDALSAPGLHDGLVEVTLPGSWSTDGQVVASTDAPLPWTVVGVTFEIAAGG